MAGHISRTRKQALHVKIFDVKLEGKVPISRPRWEDNVTDLTEMFWLATSFCVSTWLADL